MQNFSALRNGRAQSDPQKASILPNAGQRSACGSNCTIEEFAAYSQALDPFVAKSLDSYLAELAEGKDAR
jgi:hypothetical protein